MKPNYKRELETAAKQMILIHRVDTLIRLILRSILRNLGVVHAGILLYDKKRQEYIVTLSKGARGIKIPSGFAKVSTKSTLIRFFTDESLMYAKKDFLLFEKISSYIRNSKRKGDLLLCRFFEDLKEQMILYQAKACVPAFYREMLVGILFLGPKEDKKRFTVEELGFLSVLASDVAVTIKNAWLFEDLEKQLAANKSLLMNVVAAFGKAIEAKDEYTSGHTERVIEFALSIARRLPSSFGIQEQRFIEKLRIAGLLHDIGKIGVPGTILNKQGPLSNEEREVILRHPLVGAQILENIEEFNDVVLAVKYHHERYDGKGYPCGLKAKKIPFIAAIIAVADAFDAMISDRPYRKALSKQEAISEIKRERGKQFNPQVVDAFLRALDSEPI